MYLDIHIGCLSVHVERKNLSGRIPAVMIKRCAVNVAMIKKTGMIEKEGENKSYLLFENI